jgi:hypothetical protein
MAIIDSGSSHNITSDLLNLSIHSKYDGIDTVYITQLKKYKTRLVAKRFH